MLEYKHRCSVVNELGKLCEEIWTSGEVQVDQIVNSVKSIPTETVVSVVKRALNIPTYLTADSSAASTDNPARIVILADGELYKDDTVKSVESEFDVTFETSGEHCSFYEGFECPNGSVRITAIKADAEKIEPTADAEKKIEFIGDSITCAYGVDGTEVLSPLKLKINLVSTVPQYYDKLGFSYWNQFGSDITQLKEVSWDASQFVPDLVVINLGDRAKEEADFVEEYVKFIEQIRSVHPDAEILCTLGIMGQELYPQIEEAVSTYNCYTKAAPTGVTTKAPPAVATVTPDVPISGATPATINTFKPTKENVKILGRGLYQENEGSLWFGLTDSGVEYKFNGFECPNGSVRITAIKADAEKIEPTADAEKKIEFIGDSITCAYGVDGTEGTFSTKTEDGTKSYAYLASKQLNADYSMVSFSGFGIISGYSTDGFSYWNQFGSDITQLKEVSWDASQFVPDLVVINLGTNDNSYMQNVKGDRAKEEADFVEEYVKFIEQIRSVHPDAEILCTLGIMGQELYPQIEEAVSTYKAASGDEKVNAYKFNQQNINKNGKGIDWHPAPQSHVEA
ncbi:hypothetical protein LY90DRAFT_673106, partial [Neocallimastix californiae]